jgi:hypothetical protein
VRVDTELFDEQRAEAGGEESGRRHAAEVPDVGEGRAGALEAGLQRLAAHLDGDALVLGQQVALRFGPAPAGRVGFRKGEPPLADGAVQINRPNFRIVDAEQLEQFRLRDRCSGCRGADPDHSRNSRQADWNAKFSGTFQGDGHRYIHPHMRRLLRTSSLTESADIANLRSISRNLTP